MNASILNVPETMGTMETVKIRTINPAGLLRGLLSWFFISLLAGMALFWTGLLITGFVSFLRAHG